MKEKFLAPLRAGFDNLAKYPPTEKHFPLRQPNAMVWILIFISARLKPEKQRGSIKPKADILSAQCRPMPNGSSLRKRLEKMATIYMYSIQNVKKLNQFPCHPREPIIPMAVSGGRKMAALCF